MTQHDDELSSTVDASTLVERIKAESEQLCVVTGLPSRSVARSSSEIRRAVEDEGLALVIYRADDRRTGSLETVIHDFIELVDAETGVDPETMRLAEALERARAGDRHLQVDTLARLWTRLVSQRPAMLLVLDPDQADDTDADALRHFARFVYSDPLAEFAPEAQAWERPDGMMVFIGSPGFELEGHAAHIDFSDDAVAAIRDYLGRDDVIRRFLDTTEGDVGRLGDIVENLPENARHLSMYRFDALDAPQQAILQVLAVSGTQMAPEAVLDTVALLGVSEFFSRSLRHLVDDGFVRKSMGDGRIVVELDDPEFGEALRERIGDERRREVHRALADAERARHETNPDPEFLATHYVASGDHELALEFGFQAIRRLEQQRELGHARRLAARLIEIAPEERRAELETMLADVLEQMGEYRAALEACSRVGDLDGEASCEMFLRRGRLYARLGEWNAAVEAFDGAIEATCVDATRRDAVLGRADAAYSIGNYDDAIEELESLIVELVESNTDPSIRDRGLLSARNTLGKMAIVRNEFDDAVELFEANLQLATNWGWDDEIARAQANLGVVALQRDDHAEALDRLTRALGSSSARGSLPRAYCLVNLAAVYQRKDDYARALDHCLEAMRCARKAGDNNAYTISARNLATIYQDLGAYDRATSIVEHLQEEYEGDQDTLAGGWNVLVQAMLLHERGEFDAAEELFESLRSSRLASVFGSEATLRLAEIHGSLGHAERADELVAEAKTGERALYRGLADLVRAELAIDEDPESALELAHSAYDVLREAGEKNEPVRARLLIASALEALERPNEATTELARELDRVREVAERVPDRFRTSFWNKRLHRELVEALQAQDADVPDDCVATVEVSTGEEKPAERDLESAEFRAWRQRYSEIVGEDPRLHHVFRMVDRVANSDATVLIHGESGTGKELVASALHRRSDRTGKPFVKVNCAAFVENLLLSELFGHEKGAFTGAHEQKIGRFELADGGTIFLDEIGDISPNTQVALLRVLQEGTFERVGGSETMQTDVRVVCATNKDLEAMVKRGEFRLDLYYRLKGVVIEMPPLRERREDIGRLANHFARLYSPDVPKGFSNEALGFLASYSWPGNVRELQNFVRSILLFVDGSIVDVEDIRDFKEFFASGELDPSLPDIDFSEIVEVGEPEEQLATEDEADTLYAFNDPADALVEKIVAEGQSLSDIKKQLEMECIKRALIETGGNVTRAAEILQMKRPRLSQIINGDDELAELKTRLAG